MSSLRDIKKIREHLWICLKRLVKETESRQTEKGTRAGSVTRLIEERRF